MFVFDSMIPMTKEKEESGTYSGSLDSAILRSSDNLIEDMVNGVKGALLELTDQIEGYDEVELSEYSNSDNKDEHGDKNGENHEMDEEPTNSSDKDDEAGKDDEPGQMGDAGLVESSDPMDVDMEEDTSATPSISSHNRERDHPPVGRGLTR